MLHAALVSCLMLAAQEAPMGGGMGFDPDTAAGLARAQRERRPLMMYFTAEW